MLLENIHSKVSLTAGVVNTSALCFQKALKIQVSVFQDVWAENFYWHLRFQEPSQLWNVADLTVFLPFPCEAAWRVWH